jgi:hypothetical protein
MQHHVILQHRPIKKLFVTLVGLLCKGLLATWSWTTMLATSTSDKAELRVSVISKKSEG